MFKFLKRLRAKKEEPQDQPAVEQSTDLPAEEQAANIAEAPIKAPKEGISSDLAAEPKLQKPQSISSPADYETVPEEIPQPSETSVRASKPTKPQVVEEVVEVELPKRSLSDGIRSLFSSNVDIEDLEDILHQFLSTQRRIALASVTLLKHF